MQRACVCVVSVDQGVKRDGRIYCSDECADQPRQGRRLPPRGANATADARLHMHVQGRTEDQTLLPN